MLPFVCPEFSAILEMTSHFFSWTTEKEFVKDTLKVLDIAQTTVKRMSRFLVDHNLITTLCLVHIKLYHLIASSLIDIKS